MKRQRTFVFSSYRICILSSCNDKNEPLFRWKGHNNGLKSNMLSCSYHSIRTRCYNISTWGEQAPAVFVGGHTLTCRVGCGLCGGVACAVCGCASCAESGWALATTMGDATMGEPSQQTQVGVLQGRRVRRHTCDGSHVTGRGGLASLCLPIAMFPASLPPPPLKSASLSQASVSTVN
jgi:hypothetical protein